jgi:hypothetical protein
MGMEWMQGPPIPLGSTACGVCGAPYHRSDLAAAQAHAAGIHGAPNESAWSQPPPQIAAGNPHGQVRSHRHPESKISKALSLTVRSIAAGLVIAAAVLIMTSVPYLARTLYDYLGGTP